MTPEEVIKHCDLQIKLLGARAKVFLKISGKWKGRNSRLLCKGGPTGQVHADLVDGKHILVAFSAAEVKTYLEQQSKEQASNDISAT